MLGLIWRGIDWNISICWNLCVDYQDTLILMGLPYKFKY